MAAHRVRALLMGGQACVFYGAAEFSRDVDLAILADAENLGRLQSALAELAAETVYFPDLTLANLERGHGVHFRCHHPEALKLRVDVMAKMRGVAPFGELWGRRKIVAEPDGGVYELLALSDLVQAKKTQRDKDWPMIKRLLEADYANSGDEVTELQRTFWFRELRTPELLIEVVQRWPDLCAKEAAKRPLLAMAVAKQAEDLAEALEKEEKCERERDRVYWEPLMTELQALRHAKLNKSVT